MCVAFQSGYYRLGLLTRGLVSDCLEISGQQVKLMHWTVGVLGLLTIII